MPTGQVTVDPTGRLAGRGAYVCVGTDCLSIAIKKGALTRALEVPLPSTFLEAVGQGAVTSISTEGGTRGQE
jgi:predicted RNA-binding protein YlxR (DUF448 family)